ncbi:hypothetical protein A1O1_06748 [Capronia coronata CBS 617.96]|uniref:Arginine metabolism regulation protein II n=1 Tax=Capronia coronata CBS 617.96 TaxID=1182541 RepID=W9YLH9_9EURO|nr:uncharacterized protein A1O1_06748 [Capronia coronata CBS 617.96]EXJ83129.1 hypothetical protein A1O1_06748 [Capronia coronata CBS 617.96]
MTPSSGLETVLHRLEEQAVESEFSNSADKDTKPWHVRQGPFSIFPHAAKLAEVRHPEPTLLSRPMTPFPNLDLASASAWLGGDQASWASTVGENVLGHQDQPTATIDGDFSFADVTDNSWFLDTSDLPLANPSYAQDVHPFQFPNTHAFDCGHPSASSLPNGSPYLPRNVRFLLSHYTTHVIDSLSALPQTKAPWRGIHVPCALTAYGELDVLGHSSFARVSLLYSLLSLTCYHLSSLYESASPQGTTNTPLLASSRKDSTAYHWESQARKFRGIARTAFRKCLQSISTQTGDKVKYKELLMSSMTLVCAGIVGGDPWDARFFILQCEEIVNKIGRTKRRFSKKALQLHRIFAFVRVIEQTTFFQTKDQYLDSLDKIAMGPDELELVKAVPEDGFVLSATLASNHESMSDLGLDGEEEDAFFELSGFPVSLLRLMARTNSLVEELGACKAGGAHPFMSEDIIPKAAALEKEICAWRANPSGSKAESADASSGHFLPFVDLNGDISTMADAPCIMKTKLSTAVHHALLIYFFRFVRATNPTILQHYVASILTNLEQFQQAKTQYYPGSRIGTMVWPSFIAACEALDHGLRGRAIACMRHAAWAGFKNAHKAEDVVRDVWRRRDAGEHDILWSTVIRESRTILLLT